MESYISRGNQLLDNKIKQFEVLNGCWIGEVSQQDEETVLLCKDYNGHIVNTLSLNPNTDLDLQIEVIEKESDNHYSARVHLMAEQVARQIKSEANECGFILQVYANDVLKEVSKNMK